MIGFKTFVQSRFFEPCILHMIKLEIHFIAPTTGQRRGGFWMPIAQWMKGFWKKEDSSYCKPCSHLLMNILPGSSNCKRTALMHLGWRWIQTATRGSYSEMNWDTCQTKEKTKGWRWHLEQLFCLKKLKLLHAAGMTPPFSLRIPFLSRYYSIKALSVHRILRK